MLQLGEPGSVLFSKKCMDIAAYSSKSLEGDMMQSSKANYFSVAGMVHNVIQKITSFMGRDTTSELVERITHLETKLQEMKEYSESLLEEVDRYRAPMNDKGLGQLQQLMSQVVNEKRKSCYLKLLIEKEQKLQDGIQNSISQVNADYEVYNNLQQRCSSLQKENYELLETAQNLMGNVRAAVTILGCPQSRKYLSTGGMRDITINIPKKIKVSFKFDEVIHAGVPEMQLVPVCSPFVQSFMNGK